MSEPDDSFLNVQVPESPSVQTQHPRRQSYSALHCIIVVSLVANAVMVTILVLKWKPWEKDGHSLDAGESSLGALQSRRPAKTVCFSCDFLGSEVKSNDTIYDIIRSPPSNTLCCLKNNNDVTKIFQKILYDYYNHPYHGGPQTAHRQFDVKEDKKRRMGAHLNMMPMRGMPPKWTSSDPYNIAHCSGVVCQDGTIKVPVSGRYMVYSHITLRNYHDFVTNSNLIHVINRQNPRLRALGEKPLLFSKSSPATKKDVSQKTSFLCAILKLRSQDILRVTLSDDYMDLLDRGLFFNYFGIMKI